MILAHEVDSSGSMVKCARSWLVLSSLLLVAVEANPQSNGLPNIAVPVYLVNGVSADIGLGLQTINTRVPYIASASISGQNIVNAGLLRQDIYVEQGSSSLLTPVGSQ